MFILIGYNKNGIRDNATEYSLHRGRIHSSCNAEERNYLIMICPYSICRSHCRFTYRVKCGQISRCISAILYTKKLLKTFKVIFTSTVQSFFFQSHKKSLFNIYQVLIVMGIAQFLYFKDPVVSKSFF